MLSILYDGWLLSYAPNSPGAMHLLTLLACRPAEVQAHVALPAPPPPWFPEEVVPYVQLTPDHPRARLNWEQRVLPGLQSRLGTDLLHFVSPNPPLFGRSTSVISPAGYTWPVAGGPGSGQPPTRGGFFGRLREAVSTGGLARLRGLFWPEDLAAARPAGAPVISLPVAIHPAFHSQSSPGPEETASLDIPEQYVLYHGPHDEVDLRRLLEVWSWAAGPLGETYPLLLLGLDGAARDRLDALLPEFGLGTTVRALPLVSPRALAEIYRGCSTLLHTGPVPPWGDPVRPALACGRPVVASDTPLVAAIVGPGAYLAPASEARALGAALITTLIEEDVAERLSKAALERAAAWQSASFGARLLDAYQQILALG